MLGKNIRRLRIFKDMQQKELAKLSGISAATLCDIEHGAITNPGIYTVRKIAAALNVTVEELMNIGGASDNDITSRVN